MISSKKKYIPIIGQPQKVFDFAAGIQNFMSNQIFEKTKFYFLFTLRQHLLRLRKKSTSPNFWTMLVCDALCIMLAYMLAYYLRFEGFLLYERKLYYAGTLPLIFGVKLPVFYIMGLYNGMWRYTGLRDLQNIITAVLLSSVTIVSIMLFINRFQGFSRAVFILDAIICLLFISASRITIRYILQHTRSRQKERPVRKKKLLLIGAGDAAEKAVREIADNSSLPYEVVGFVDDNPAKIGMRIHGIPVLGCIDDLSEFADQIQVEELLIAMVAITGQQMKRIVGLCQQTGLPFKVLPGLGELIDGKVSVKTIREISYKDLLGREEVVLEQEKIGCYLTGKTVLITGAGGSIGSELCRQIVRFSPGRLILYDSSEENLYTIQMELLHERHIADAVAVLGKVQDVRLLDLVFRQHRPTVVFHAAAYKHVPLIERNPWQAVYNNVFATQLLIEAAILYQAEHFVLVSTDKAVRPTNVMGASKRLTELLMLAYARNNWDGSFSGAWRKIPECNELFSPFRNETPSHTTSFMAVRFGNVIGSSGSVMPLFKRQIERGGPVTVTHPDITRYFMSIEEAAQLILQAGSMGGDGEIFILKMGEPIKIDNMAREMIKLAGKEPDVDIEIHYTGLREGEKLYEELITVGEGIVDTHHEKIMVLRGENGLSCRHLHNSLEKLAGDASAYSGRAIKETLQTIIPEYHPDTESRSIRNVKVSLKAQKSEG